MSDAESHSKVIAYGHASRWGVELGLPIGLSIAFSPAVGLAWALLELGGHGFSHYRRLVREGKIVTGEKNRRS